MKVMVKKFACFAVLCLWVLGLIGGVGFCLSGGSVPCAAGVGFVGGVGFPTIKRAFDYLKS